MNEYDTLVLSGASSKALTFLGALQYCYDFGLIRNVKNYVGTSAGAMICFFLAIGYSPSDIIVYICVQQLMDKMLNFNILSMIQGGGAMTFNPIQESIEKMTIEKIGYLPTLNDLKEKFDVNLTVVTYNLSKQKVVYLNYKTHPNFPCVTALKMSGNLPLVFEKFKYGTDYYIDGGIADNFPLRKGEEIGKHVLALALSGSVKKYDHSNSILEYIYSLMFIPIKSDQKNQILQKSEESTVALLESNNLKFFDFKISTREKLDIDIM